VAGLKFLVRQPVLRFMALWVAVVNAAVGAASATLILFAVHTLHLTPAEFGLLMTSTGAGALLGAVSAERIVRLLGRTGTMFWSSVVAGLATWGIGLLSSAPAVYALLLLTGLGGVSFSVVGRSLRQSVTPREVMGRVTSVYRLVGFGAVPVGSLLGGLLAKQYGLHMPFVVAGVAMVASTVVFGSCVTRARPVAAAA
jgi:MFS family permease